MPPANLPPRLTPSLFDRLTVADPDGQPAPGWGYDHRQMLDAVRRDLEELLNTRQPDPPPEFPEVARSVVAYGLPDLSSVGGASIPQRDALCRVIEATMEYAEGDKSRASRLLNIGRKTLYRKLDQYASEK